MISKNKRYFPSEIEQKWVKIWQEEDIYKFKFSSDKSSKGKYYNLVELPYPSGDLHLGHWFAFTPADAHARFKKMKGYNVFFPNGFDAFGLPAENAAIKRGVHPKDWTMKNIENMTKQFATMGTMIDWTHTAITCLPEYYKWNQWIFLKMFEKGIAYRGKALSNWCPVDQTVLANEHIEGGKCWRCGNEVIQKEVEQWFLKITDYADRLIWKEEVRGSHFSGDARRAKPQSSENTRSLNESLSPRSSNKDVTAFGSPQSEPPHLYNQESIIEWPKQVREGQNNWIGKSEGMLIEFKVQNSELGIEVFTTRPETIDGATFLVVAPELAESLLNLSHVADDAHLGSSQSSKYSRSLSESRLSNSKVNSSEQESSFGSSAGGQSSTANLQKVMDYIEKAKKKTEMERKEDRTKSGVFSGIYAKNPVTGREIPVWIADYVLAGYGTGAIMAVPFADERDREFAQKFELPVDKTEFNAKPVGKKWVNYHLRDWSISRQRYWGTPVPIIYCHKCREVQSSKFKVQGKQGSDYSIIDGEEYAMIPVPFENLPVELPYNVDYTPKGKPPLATDEEWLNVKCPKCGGPAKRDAETLDTFFDSAWYYYRYVSPDYDKLPFDKEKVAEIMPVDVYFGGSEHTLGHTLYARFFTKFFKDIGLVSFDEFAKKRVQHGVILGPDGNRMSKSRGNVVNPDEVVGEYGADAVRLYLCFMMPYEATAPWSMGAISGIYRFLKRVWDLQFKIQNSEFKMTDEDLIQMNKTIKKVGEDLDNFHFNTAVAALMTWINYLSSKKGISEEEFKNFLKLLSPFAPFITEELWQTVALRSSSIRQSRFSGDARQAKPQSSKEDTRSLNESLSPRSSNKDVTAFGSPQNELPHDKLNSIHSEEWPEFDDKYLAEEEAPVAVQINGKLRDTIVIKNSEIRVQKRIEEEARKSKNVMKYLEGKKIIKVIYVEGKIINFVIN